jgi:hypothetical protein
MCVRESKARAANQPWFDPQFVKQAKKAKQAKQAKQATPDYQMPPRLDQEAGIMPMADCETTLSLEQAAWYAPLPSYEPRPLSPDLASPEPSPTPEAKKRSYTYHTRKPRGPNAKSHKKKNSKELFREMQHVFSKRFQEKLGGSYWGNILGAHIGAVNSL